MPKLKRKAGLRGRFASWMSKISFGRLEALKTPHNVVLMVLVLILITQLVIIFRPTTIAVPMKEGTEYVKIDKVLLEIIKNQQEIYGKIR